MIEVLKKKLTKTPFYYIYKFVKIKNRLPRVLRPRDYSDFIFRDNLFQRLDKHYLKADKYRVREYIEKKGLKHILPKVFQVCENADQIIFDELPNKFALKCNHSAGQNIICFDKSKLDIEEAKNKINKWLSKKHPVHFERHYRLIKPLVFCEEFLGNSDGSYPVDYKIHCAHGNPIFIQVCVNRTITSQGLRLIYSPSWEKLDYVVEKFKTKESDQFPKPPEKQFNKMMSYAKILSSDLEYGRIDFYIINKKIYFSEITLTPTSGWLDLYTQEARDLMGEKIMEKI